MFVFLLLNCKIFLKNIGWVLHTYQIYDVQILSPFKWVGFSLSQECRFINRICHFHEVQLMHFLNLPPPTVNWWKVRAWGWGEARAHGVWHPVSQEGLESLWERKDAG